MEDKFIIVCRYEYWKIGGKTFTEWFAYNSNPMLKKDALDEIKNMKSYLMFIDKKTKLKHEYDIKLYSEYMDEQKMIQKEADKAAKQYEKYLKSSKCKEIQKKKRQASKELKERQKKYLEEHEL